MRKVGFVRRFLKGKMNIFLGLGEVSRSRILSPGVGPSYECTRRRRNVHSALSAFLPCELPGVTASRQAHPMDGGPRDPPPPQPTPHPPPPNPPLSRVNRDNWARDGGCEWRCVERGEVDGKEWIRREVSEELRSRRCRRAARRGDSACSRGDTRK